MAHLEESSGLVLVNVVDDLCPRGGLAAGGQQRSPLVHSIQASGHIQPWVYVGHLSY